MFHDYPQKRPISKAASAPPTNPPIKTQTGAPGPHTKPAKALPAAPPAMPATLMAIFNGFSINYLNARGNWLLTGVYLHY
ncbi:hypothetical protein KYI92_18370 [Pantoea allii]|uniref:Uncharacterized protein n=1 Tax=Pantoea allii TaxID=574096 RepID=A0ABS6VIQ0_9GAMM|nr:hypothetical protein [Pantoea allii]MBW1259141.1 hypothetical protein [Pantoea allii]MBW1290337.1 hypothetical protein [Pantoea allii]